MNNFCIKKYKSIIGLEVHLQLLTKSKFFSSELNNYTLNPNKNIDLFTLAHPGVLPSINKKAIEFAIKMGLICHSDITKKNFFDTFLYLANLCAFETINSINFFFLIFKVQNNYKNFGHENI